MPRAGLTARIVVVRAAELADEVGYDGLTLAALATRLGVRVPSLYKHVEGLDAVRRGVAILAVRELGQAMADALAACADPDPGARLRAIADGFRGYATTHPGRYAATVRAAPPDDAEHAVASEAALAPALTVLGERGLAGAEAIDAARALRALLHGFVTLEDAGGFGLPRDVDRSFAWSVAALDRGMPHPSMRPGPAQQDRSGEWRSW